MDWLDDFGLVGVFDLLDILVWWWPRALIVELSLVSREVSWWIGRGNSDGGACIVVVNVITGGDVVNVITGGDV
jgi:hypothetical protein